MDLFIIVIIVVGSKPFSPIIFFIIIMIITRDLKKSSYTLIIPKFLDITRVINTIHSRLMQVPKPWKKSFFVCHAIMEQDLLVTNPTMAGVLDLWHRSFG